MAQLAQDACGSTAQIVPVTAHSGPAVVTSPVQAAEAASAAAALVEQHGAGCSAIILAISIDCGLQVIRKQVSVPVVGLTEASLVRAQALSRKIGLVTIGSTMLLTYRALIASYGFEENIMSWQIVNRPVAFNTLTDPDLVEDLRLATQKAVAEGAQCVVLVGAVLAGYAKHVQTSTQIPVLDAVTCATEEALYRLRELL